MKCKIFKIIGISLSAILVIMLLPVLFSLVTRGCIPSYTREELGIYMPYFYADDFEVSNNFTDSHRYYCFDLNNAEIKKVQDDIKSNSAWFRFTGTTEDILSLYPFDEIIPADADFNNCYVALYHFSEDCFFYDTDKYADKCISSGCAVYDEVNNKYYYLEMLWQPKDKY